MWDPSGSVFAWCTSLTKVDLPSTIEALGMSSFNSCPLEQLIIRTTTPPNISGFANNPFGWDDSIYENCKVYVPASAIDDYKADEDGWAQFQNILPITDETTNVSAIQRQSPAADVAYDLQGRRVAQPANGLYIVNGCKVLMK